MLDWKKLGYFVGKNVVYLRRDPPYSTAAVASSAGDDGDDADDLMNDLEEVEEEEVVGPWFSSENCTFE